MATKPKILYLVSNLAVILWFYCFFAIYREINYSHLAATRESVSSSPQSLIDPSLWQYPINKTRIGANAKAVNITTSNANKTTLIVMAYESHPPLLQLIAQYTQSDFASILYEIILVWNSPTELFDLEISEVFVPIIVYQQRRNSLANRWMLPMYHHFSTQSVMFMDDESMFNLENLQCLFNVWANNANKVIAPGGDHYLRYFMSAGHTLREYEYVMDTARTNAMNHFQMLLPTGMTMSVQYLQQISHSFLEYNLIQIIDKQSAHCDDIAMSLSLSRFVGGQRFLFGIDQFNNRLNGRDKYQKSVSGTNNTKRSNERTECLNMIIDRLTRNEAETTGVAIVKSHFKDSDRINCHHISHYCPTNACL